MRKRNTLRSLADLWINGKWPGGIFFIFPGYDRWTDDDDMLAIVMDNQIWFQNEAESHALEDIWNVTLTKNSTTGKT